MASNSTVTNTPDINNIKSDGLNRPNINFPLFVLAGIKYTMYHTPFFYYAPLKGFTGFASELNPSSSSVGLPFTSCITGTVLVFGVPSGL